jgi:NAD(P)-dependent dehydrogenase (short-subunit alcohol dehydrogenase family)
MMGRAKLLASRESSRLVSMAGRRAVVVGGTSGIGKGVALRLAEAGCSVVVAGRSEERGREVVAALTAAAEASAPSAAPAAPVEPPAFTFEPLDCFSLGDVAAFAARRAAEPLDLLVLTQGMATMQGFTPTADGLDQKLSLHYFSRIVLARALAPTLSRSDDGRVLSVLSAGMHGAYTGYADDFDLSGGAYSVKNAADAAGFYNDIAMDRLADEFGRVTFAHASPGFVATAWGAEMPTPVRALVRVLQLLGRDLRDCGEYMFKPLYERRLRRAGFVLVDQYGNTGPTKTDLHEEAKASVWKSTERVLEKWK